MRKETYGQLVGLLHTPLSGGLSYFMKGWTIINGRQEEDLAVKKVDSIDDFIESEAQEKDKMAMLVFVEYKSAEFDRLMVH